VVSSAVAVDAKICGLTRPEDATLAAALGAWRLGVIFAGGPREVSVAQAAGVVAAGEGVPVIGVFGSQDADTILQITRAAGLRGAQLHGAGPPGRAQALRDAGLEVWGVALLDDPATVAERVAAAGVGSDVVLVEPRLVGGSGGRGVALPWELAHAARVARGSARLALAGGLSPDNLRAAIATGAPDVVDVSSGVEQEPGIKDPHRLAAFLEIVRDSRPAH
jgi:phosphoribosylanthranilate isomerase